MKLKKYELKKKQAYSGEFSKPRLISQTYNPWNSRSRLNKKVQFPTNWMMNSKNNINKKIKIKSDTI
jgi:hypothetical protein